MCTSGEGGQGNSLAVRLSGSLVVCTHVSQTNSYRIPVESVLKAFLFRESETAEVLSSLLLALFSLAHLCA